MPGLDDLCVTARYGIVKFEVYEKALGYCPGIGRGGFANFKVEISSISESFKAKEEFRRIINNWNEWVDKDLAEASIDEFFNYLENIIDSLNKDS